MSPTSYLLLPYRLAPLREGRLWGQLTTPSGVGPGFQKLLCPLSGLQAPPGLHRAKCCPLTQGRYPEALIDQCFPFLHRSPKSQVPGRLAAVLGGRHLSPKAGGCCSPERLDGATLLPSGSTSQRPFWCSSWVLFRGSFVLVGSWLVCWGFCFSSGQVC